MDENMTKFNEKIAELLEIAKKEKNVLVQEEIEAHFKDMDLTPDKMGIICEYLEKNGVDILKTTGDTDVDDDIILEMENEEEEEDLENIDLSVPDGVSIEDPVRMYLKEIGKVPLLIENNGAPPPPNRLLNAVMITMIGKHKPIAPKAVVPTPGIRAI